MWPFNRIEKEMKRMNESINQIKTLVDDVRAKSATVITKLGDAKTSLDAANKKLDEVLSQGSGEDADALNAVKDELQGVDDSLTAAIGTVQSAPADTGGTTPTP
jgi:DNA anti-recombination protein RmuC